MTPSVGEGRVREYWLFALLNEQDADGGEDQRRRLCERLARLGGTLLGGKGVRRESQRLFAMELETRDDEKSALDKVKKSTVRVVHCDKGAR